MARDLLGLDINVTGGQYNEKTDDGCVQLIEGWINSNTGMEVIGRMNDLKQMDYQERMDRRCE